ncbi:MAG: hypothetical protein R3F59_34850 [Myxococcota bacterium]
MLLPGVMPGRRRSGAAAAETQELLDLRQAHLGVELATLLPDLQVGLHPLQLGDLELQHLDGAAQADHLGVHLVQVVEAIGVRLALLADHLLELLDAQLRLGEQRLELRQAHLCGGHLPRVLRRGGGAGVRRDGDDAPQHQQPEGQQAGGAHDADVIRWR